MSADQPARRHPAALSPEQLEAIGKSIRTLKDTLEPHLVSLTPEQRRTMRPLSDDQVEFMNAVFEHAKAHPELVPDGIDMEKFERDVTSFRNLRAIAGRLGAALEALEERMLQVDPMSRFEAADALHAAMTYSQSPRPAQGDGPADAPPDGAA